MAGALAFTPPLLRLSFGVRVDAVADGEGAALKVCSGPLEEIFPTFLRLQLRGATAPPVN